ncbi:hypothetical protein, partial [Rhodanobacter thiooxydans]
AARLGQKPAVIGISAQLIENAQALESLLIQQGVVAIAKSTLSVDQINLLRETGVVVITTTVEGTDTDLTVETVEEAAEQIVELVRL